MDRLAAARPGLARYLAKLGRCVGDGELLRLVELVGDDKGAATLEGFSARLKPDAGADRSYQAVLLVAGRWRTPRAWACRRVPAAPATVSSVRALFSSASVSTECGHL